MQRVHRGQVLKARDVNSLRSRGTFARGIFDSVEGVVQRSRRVVSSGGETPVIWGKIIENLAYPDPEGTPEEGVAQYKVEPLGTSIEVSPRPLGQEANYPDLINSPPDMRLFVPWYQVGDVVPLVRRVVTVGEGESEETETLYFFDLQMTRVAEALDGVQSIAWNADEHRLMAVFGDVETEFEGD